MTTLLVTGVSGPLGSRVLPVVAADPSIDVVVGVDRRPLSVSAPKLRFVQNDLAEVDFASLLEGVDVIVHLAMTEVGIMRKMLAAASASNVRQIVATSSAAVFGAWPTNAVPLPEDAPLRPNPGFAYATGLAEQERLLSEWRLTHPDRRVAVLRMAMMLGGGFERALTFALGGIDVHGGAHITRPVQFLHIDDAVSAIALAVGKSLDGSYNVAPKDFVVDHMARAVAGSAPHPALPGRLTTFLDTIAWRRRLESDLSAAKPYLVSPWVMSSDRLRAEGWTPNYSSEEVLVAESVPTWWASLRPGQRRALVTGGMLGSIAGGTALAVAGGALLAWTGLRTRNHRK